MRALPTNKDLLDFYRYCIILFSPCDLCAVFLADFVSCCFNVARNGLLVSLIDLAHSKD